MNAARFWDTVYSWLPKRAVLFLHRRNLAKRLRILGPSARAILTESYNGLLLLPASDMTIGRELAFGRAWERPRIEFLLRLLPPSWNVLIIGPHVGSVLVPLARHVASVVGIEANPETFSLLQMNITLNRLTNVRALNFAAGDTNRTVSMLLNSHNTGSSKVAWGDSQRNEFVYDAPRHIPVEMRPVDGSFGEAQFPFVLIDAEGAEPLILEGMFQTLASVQVLQIEVYGPHIRHLSRVSAEEFVAPLLAHFDFAIQKTDPFEPVPKEGFAGLVEDIVVRNGLEDLIFFRAPLHDHFERAINPSI